MSEHPIPVIDLFAGPGGLSEGFASYRTSDGRAPFAVCLSIEKDPFAHRTLQLRSFYRQFDRNKVPSAYYALLRGDITETELYNQFPEEAQAAADAALLGTLGGPDLSASELYKRIESVIAGRRAWVLIGGPPCQAYSIAGRSRNKGKKGYRLERDERHALYQEYLRIVAEHWPPVFVMENVKGLLSTRIRDESLFGRICADLQDPNRALGRKSQFRYRILSLEPTGLFEASGFSDYVIRAERHGVPQCRHRVILLGVRSDLAGVRPKPLPYRSMTTVQQVLAGLPPLRSGLSREQDSPQAWIAVFGRILKRRWLSQVERLERGAEIRALIESTARSIEAPAAGRGGDFVPCTASVDFPEKDWFLDHRIGGVCNHETKAHMEKDLHRYLFASCFAQVRGTSPRLSNFPVDLHPDHLNVIDAIEGGYFNDRFRVQVAGKPSTTITSHIQKDGHYYIHFDPRQCRSLTVREAARLQTFPDNYYFGGPKTKQYHQVGNAVPPFLARDIAESVFDLLGQAGMIQSRGQNQQGTPQLEHVTDPRT